MRRRTENEKKALGLITPILREINIKQATRGYVPLVDVLCYAYANPMATFQKAMKELMAGNYYVGVKRDEEVDYVEERYQQAVNQRFTIYPSMRRCIITGLERTDKEVLVRYDLEKLTIILEAWNPKEDEKANECFFKAIGNRYARYDTYEERVIVYFCHKILNYIGCKTEL